MYSRDSGLTKEEILERVKQQGSIELGIQSNSYKLALELVKENLLTLDKSASNYQTGDLYRTFKKA
jgi:hypothetical protein